MSFTPYWPESVAFAADAITLRGARVARTAYNARYRTLSVRGSCIEAVSMVGAAGPNQEPAGGVTIDLAGYLMLPGLINAHDHLDFSNFPRLGRGPWSNWRVWAAAIHNTQRPCIKKCLRVPHQARLWWGGIRNLLCGVTTVSHHNPYVPEVFDGDFPVRVASEHGWAHSLADPHCVVELFRQAPTHWPFILHLAEGTDAASQREFDELEHLLPLDGRTVMVHCVGLTPSQWDRAARVGAGVVWCPSSNMYTLGQTLSREQVMTFPNIALGSDSPLSGTGDLLDEIRMVYDEFGIPAPLIYELVTSRPARLLRLSSGEGMLQPGSKADLIVIRDTQLTPAQTLVELTWRDIELVMKGGRIVLLSTALAGRIPGELRSGLEHISINGTVRLVRAPVADLWSETCIALRGQPQLSGRMLFTGNGSADSLAS